MSARLFIMIVSLIQIAFYAFESIVIELQRKKPLPLEVSDIYEKARYETYLAYAKDNRKLSIVMKVISFILLYVLTYSNIYTMIDTMANGNVYLIYFLTFALYMKNKLLLILSISISYIILYSVLLSTSTL